MCKKEKKSCLIIYLEITEVKNNFVCSEKKMSSDIAFKIRS